MFEPGDRPRVFALPPGVDFPRALIDGLRARCDPDDPAALARATLIVNTRRMARRLRTIFDAGLPALLPRIGLVTDFGGPAASARVPPAVPALRRRLDLRQLVIALIEANPGIAPRAAAYDLADSLARLMDEIEGEGLTPDAITRLDVSQHSEHWARMLAFIGIIRRYFDGTDPGLDALARQRLVVEATIADWQASPPQHPVILAGSTGSRGTTRLLIEAVARLPQGAVVLPGFDTDLPDDVWERLDQALLGEDHPQFRFRKLMLSLGIGPGDIAPWTDAAPPAPQRNRAVSLALRPAPVTHAWREEGPRLPDPDAAFADVTLVEAETPRAEARAIALRLRQAAEEGQTAALITPDRMLTRQVSALLDRWGIEADDSGGLPLNQSPPGRLLRQVAQLFSAPLTADLLLALLKHPLCHVGSHRGEHLRMTRELELHLRAEGLPFPDRAILARWAARQTDAMPGWADWVASCTLEAHDRDQRDLADWTRDLGQRAEALAAGCGGGDASELWARNAGQGVRRVFDDLTAEAGHGGAMSAGDFVDLLGAILAAGEEVRDRDAPHPAIMFWGTLEAHVQGADLLILGGLNEGTWPGAPRPDPWLNRDLRDRAGLLLPDREIGLSAHDFQQAIAAREVWLTRAIRSDDAETVPSRWINRLMNLLGGLEQSGPSRAATAMRARGAHWLALAGQMDAAPPMPPAPRPSPRPPVEARPRVMSVTDISRLVRDPYAVYAKRVLRLRPLNPLLRGADPKMRGTILHDMLEAYVNGLGSGASQLTAASLLATARDWLTREVPWPTARLMWLSQMERQSQWFVEEETARRNLALPLVTEGKARAQIASLGFTLTARADRIDADADGNLRIYDYKAGAAPTPKQQKAFDKQLLLEAAMAELGAFEGLPPSPVVQAAYIGLRAQKTVPAPLGTEPPDKVWSELIDLLGEYLSPGLGFTSRRMVEKERFTGDYDQLARYGEWDDSTPATPQDLT
ncbi:MAG: double-strand break repair protein AddB, partial [Rhodobacteraceae bacterium]